jgi:hypothetical protein
MLGFNSWRLFKFLATFLCVVGIVSFAVAYFIPAPPTTVTIATAFKGSTFVYYGEKYREIFARLMSSWSCERPMGPWTTSVFCRIQNPVSTSAL